MELKDVVLVIVKIIISIPTILILHINATNGAALMGGHLDNKNSTDAYLNDYDLYDYREIFNNTEIRNSGNPQSNHDDVTIKEDSEEIPDPSPLVVPGYNLPENIFNKGKPFYLEKDPLTGRIDFDTKSTESKTDDDLYEYVDDEPNTNIYDKANIDRKDGSLSSHKASDVNQLTPNFHDFLNLPVKYNSDKYVYPLISSSYANTKVQGNVNKYHNHKDITIKTTTRKPIQQPTYYASTTMNPATRTTEYVTTTPTPVTTVRTSTTTRKTYPTTKATNLMNSGMNHPSFNQDFEDYYESNSQNEQVYTTSKTVNNIYLTTRPPALTTTKRPMSIFEQLFGEYDDTVAPTEKTKAPPLFSKMPPLKHTESTTSKSSSTTPYNYYPNSHAGPNVLTGSNMGIQSNAYEYEEYDDYNTQDNLAVESKPEQNIKPLESNEIANTSSTNNVPKEEVDEPVNYTVTPEPESTTAKVTSLPLGENHVPNLNNRQPIIVATQNIREQLNHEKVPIKVPSIHQLAPSQSSIHIAPDQDTVSFVVGHHQNVDGGQYVGSAVKETAYDNNPFKPFYGQNSVSYTVQASSPPIRNHPEITGSSVTIQPQRNSEASLSIGVPVNGVKQIPGQVVDDDLVLDNIPLEYPKSPGQKVVFPDDKSENFVPQIQPIPSSAPNREVLKLSSQPMYHQLPSDLTPPKEEPIAVRKERPRPPWDPRPGHFHSGKPEYVRPPRPPPEIAYKRIDTLPNILPQFRPNMKNGVPYHYDNRLNRQPLLDRPSNRPAGFYEKLQPPPPPPKSLHNLRKSSPIPSHQINAEDRIINDPPLKSATDQFDFFKSPPMVVLANRRIGNVEGDVETLQMIQAKNADKKEKVVETILPHDTPKNNSDKPLYVVYPVNTPPIKLDVIDTNKKESVVIGTRAELPLPPSKINHDFNYEQKDRNDAPILRPHTKPSTFPIKSDFPYPLERPDGEPSHNNLDDDATFSSHWGGVGENIQSRIVTNTKPNQISATLKTYTDKPIAVAYTPTEPHDLTDRYSMPNYASPVIPEIRPGSVDDEKPSRNEFTVSAVMHTHPQLDGANHHKKPEGSYFNMNHRVDEEVSNAPPQLDFQAPFQASVNVDSQSQGWSVVRNEKKSTTESPEVTTLPLATTSEFDIENFKPELIGGFKPIYDLPQDYTKDVESSVNERQER